MTEAARVEWKIGVAVGKKLPWKHKSHSWVRTGHQQCITRVWVGKKLGMCTTQKVVHQCHKGTPAPKFSQYCDDADLGGNRQHKMLSRCTTIYCDAPLIADLGKIATLWYSVLQWGCIDEEKTGCLVSLMSI